MDTSIDHYPRFERPGFMSAALAISGVLLAIGIAPRNERALFMRDGFGPPAKAFAAVVAPLDALRAQVEKGAIDTALRDSRSVAEAAVPNMRRYAAAGPPLLAGTIPALISNAPRSAGADGVQGFGGTGGPAAETGSQSGVVAAPNGGQPGIGGGGGGGGGGVAPAEVQNPPAGGPGLSPVPEPSTWAMLLIGFFGIGNLMRRPAGRRRRLHA